MQILPRLDFSWTVEILDFSKNLVSNEFGAK